jgi:hypothetical protein
MSGPFVFRGSRCPGGTKPPRQSVLKVLFRSISKHGRTRMLLCHFRNIEETRDELPLLHVCSSLTLPMHILVL